MTLRNGVLVYLETDSGGDVPLTIRTTKLRLLALLGRDNDSAGREFDGEAGNLQTLFGVIDPGDQNFAIVTPERGSRLEPGWSVILR